MFHTKNQLPPELEELKDVTRKLLSLLDYPQPGLLSWNRFLKWRLDELKTLIEKINN